MDECKRQPSKAVGQMQFSFHARAYRAQTLCTDGSHESIGDLVFMTLTLQYQTNPGADVLWSETGRSSRLMWTVVLEACRYSRNTSHLI